MQKSLFIGLLGVLLLGFGCSGMGNGSADVIEGPWHLAVDMPAGWVMVPPYDEGVDMPPTGNPVTSDMSDIVLQSTAKIVALTGSSQLPEGTFATNDYTFIRVFRMDKHSVIPSDAEDIGQGFFKLEKGVNATYYYEGVGSNYKFIVYQDGQGLDVAEDVITSAKEVTSLTGTATE